MYILSVSSKGFSANFVSQNFANYNFVIFEKQSAKIHNIQNKFFFVNWSIWTKLAKQEKSENALFFTCSRTDKNYIIFEKNKCIIRDPKQNILVIDINIGEIPNFCMFFVAEEFREIWLQKWKP